MRFDKPSLIIEEVRFNGYPTDVDSIKKWIESKGDPPNPAPINTENPQTMEN